MGILQFGWLGVNIYFSSLALAGGPGSLFVTLCIVWGILAAALRFVPYLGAVVSTMLPILASLASSTGWSQTWLAAGVILGLETITANMISGR